MALVAATLASSARTGNCQRTILSKHIYFLGIGGTLMGSLALLARETGRTRVRFRQGVVSADERSAGRSRHRRVRRLRSQATRIPRRIWSSSVTRSCRVVIPASNTFSNRDCRIRPAPNGSAARFCKGRWVLAVSGTHGKTTTASMLAHILDRAGLDPGFLIGGVPQDFGRSARLGSTTVFRRRSRRIRHVVFRPPFEVRALPAAHARHQQPRIRPRRHLPGPRRDSDAVPSLAAHGAVAAV